MININTRHFEVWCSDKHKYIKNIFIDTINNLCEKYGIGNLNIKLTTITKYDERWYNKYYGAFYTRKQ